MRTGLLIITLIAALWLQTSPAAAADDWGPWEVRESAAEVEPYNGQSLTAVIKLFQKYISPVDGARCNMYPTCSAYAVHAVRKHGPLLGTLIFVDRLYHESDPIEHKHPIVKHGYIRYDDPLINNTFWLNDQP